MLTSTSAAPAPGFFQSLRSGAGWVKRVFGADPEWLKGPRDPRVRGGHLGRTGAEIWAERLGRAVPVIGGATLLTGAGVKGRGPAPLPPGFQGISPEDMAAFASPGKAVMHATESMEIPKLSATQTTGLEAWLATRVDARRRY